MVWFRIVRDRRDWYWWSRYVNVVDDRWHTQANWLRLSGSLDCDKPTADGLLSALKDCPPREFLFGSFEWGVL